MKKFLVTFGMLAALGGSVFGFIIYQKSNLENAVVDYLISEENIAKSKIITSEAFIANLSGARNYMVSVKLKNDDKSYFYYRENGKIHLESYTENGREFVQ